MSRGLLPRRPPRTAVRARPALAVRARGKVPGHQGSECQPETAYPPCSAAAPARARPRRRGFGARPSRLRAAGAYSPKHSYAVGAPRRANGTGLTLARAACSHFTLPRSWSSPWPFDSASRLVTSSCVRYSFPLAARPCLPRQAGAASALRLCVGTTRGESARWLSMRGGHQLCWFLSEPSLLIVLGIGDIRRCWLCFCVVGGDLNPSRTCTPSSSGQPAHGDINRVEARGATSYPNCPRWRLRIASWLTAFFSPLPCAAAVWSTTSAG
jgi:hypothetical protein